MEQITAGILSNVIKARKSESHKGTYGKVMLIGGNKNFGGAIIMAAEACVKSGAGLVTVATNPHNLTALHSRIPEAMYVDYHNFSQMEKLIPKQDVVLIGSGLGTGENGLKILRFVTELVTPKQTVIMDASALKLIGNDKTLLPKQANKVILTPHQKEWQDLSGIKISHQDDETNRHVLHRLGENLTLVLKSNHTRIYHNHTIYQNPLGNPGMATGGMGDTLAGIIAGFVAQFGNETQTIMAAIYIHSYIGDRIAQEKYIVLPTEISLNLPRVMKQFEN